MDGSLVRLLDQPWAYGHDMRMFGYNVQGYFASLNISIRRVSLEAICCYMLSIRIFAILSMLQECH